MSALHVSIAEARGSRLLIRLRVFARSIETFEAGETRPSPLSTSYAEKLRGAGAEALADRGSESFNLPVSRPLVAALRNETDAAEFVALDVTLRMLSVSASYAKHWLFMSNLLYFNEN